MIRKILSVVLAYIAMFAVVMIGLTAAYTAMGADRIFQPGTYEVSTLWIIVSGAVAVVAAVLGGFVCAKVGRSRGAVATLAGLVLVLGGVMAAGIALAPAPTPEEAVRSGQVTHAEARANARQPLWVAVANPLIGAVCVLAGAALAGTRPARSDGQPDA